MKKIFHKKIFAFFLSALLVLALSLPAFLQTWAPSPRSRSSSITRRANAMRLPCWAIPGSAGRGALQTSTGADGLRETWEAFRNYPAPEGYYFLDYFQEYPGDADAEFVWGLLPAQQVLCSAL